MKRAETGRPHLFRLIAMIHKTAYILAYDMLRRTSDGLETAITNYNHLE